MIFIMMIVTLLHALNNNTVDIYLVLILVVGSVIGAQFGTKISGKLKSEELRAMMSILVLIFGFKFGYDLLFHKIIPSADITISHAAPPAISYATELILHTAQNFPGLYAVGCMIVAILVGVIAAYGFKRFI